MNIQIQSKLDEIFVFYYAKHAVETNISVIIDFDCVLI
jgi:hypothetical protein